MTSIDERNLLKERLVRFEAIAELGVDPQSLPAFSAFARELARKALELEDAPLVQQAQGLAEAISSKNTLTDKAARDESRSPLTFTVWGSAVASLTDEQLGDYDRWNLRQLQLARSAGSSDGVLLASSMFSESRGEMHKRGI